MNKLSIDIQLTGDDVKDSVRWIFPRRLRSAYAIGVILFATGLWQMLAGRTPKSDSVEFMGMGAVCLAIPWMISVVLAHRAKARFTPSSPVRMEITESGLSSPSNPLQTEPWSALGKTIELAHIFLIQDRRGHIHAIIPKRSFQSADEMAFFRKMAGLSKAI